MKIELLAKGNVEKMFNEKEIPFVITYSGDTYKVVEIEKNDMNYLAGILPEVSSNWWYYSKGARTGSACDFFRINGHDLIGWSNLQHKDNYKTLMDYFNDEIGITEDEDICDYAVSLAKTNGMSMAKLFKVCEG